MSNDNSTSAFKHVETITSSIFIFLAVLLCVSRIPSPEIILPIYIVVISSLLVTLIIYLIRGGVAALISFSSLWLFFALIVGWAFATNSFYSPGDDDYGYHILAVWEHANGWDPFTSSHDNIWLDSYPSGLYVLESYLVSLTGLLLSGRALVLGLAIAVALLAFLFYHDRVAPHFPYFKNIYAILFAGIVVGNPVAISQITTHYVDAPLYFFGCALVFFLISDAFMSNRLAVLSAISCAILMVNTKTAALYYVPVIVVGGFILDLILSSKGTGLYARAFKWIQVKGILYVIVFAFGIVVIGYKPFVTNFRDHGEFLYPAVHEIMQGNVPENVLPLSSPMKFLYGVAATTGDSSWPLPFHAPIELKIPGTFALEEFKYLRFDTRRGGFGPFFSLALLASIFAYILSRLASRNRDRYTWNKEGDGIAAFSLVILTGSMFFPESWWARYIPFAWLSVILFAVTSLFLKGKGTALILSRIMTGVAIAALLGCMLAALGGSFRVNRMTLNKTAAIEVMKNFPIVELYPEIDPRITRDYQSKTITSAGDTWGRLLKERGVNVLVLNGLGNDIIDEKKYCHKSGWFDADVLWCLPNKAVK